MTYKLESKPIKIEACVWPPMMEERFLGKLPDPFRNPQAYCELHTPIWLYNCAHCPFGVHSGTEKVIFRLIHFGYRDSKRGLFYFLDWEQVDYKNGDSKRAKVPEMQCGLHND
jgi:hypothetical protein